MALIQCSECGKEISDKALSCVGCGLPLDKVTIRITDTRAESDEPDVADPFAWRRMKRMRSLSLVGILIGFGMTFFGGETETSGLILMFLGILGWMVSVLAAWGLKYE